MKTILNVKIDKSTKDQAAKLAGQMGLSLSAVVNSFLRNYIQTQELHVTAAPRMTPYLEKIIDRARRENELDSPAFSEAKSLMKWVKAQK